VISLNTQRIATPSKLPSRAMPSSVGRAMNGQTIERTGPIHVDR